MATPVEHMAMASRGLVYREITPSPDLAEDIEYFWTLGSRQPLPSAFVRPSMGKSAIDLIITLKGHFCAGAEKHLFGSRSLAAPYLVGPLSAPATIHSLGRCEAVGLRFRPGRAQSFIYLPMHQLTDHVADLAAVVSPLLARRLAGAAFDTTATLARVRAMERVLFDMRTRRTQRACPDRIAIAIDLIERAEGNLRVDDLARRLDMGARQLERLFRHAVGVSPKLASRIARVRHAMTLIPCQSNVDFADIVHACGFYDQAHFIREFRSISGMTPGQYATGCSPTPARHPMSDSYNTPNSVAATVRCTSSDGSDQV